jgi:hypothetical protein
MPARFCAARAGRVATAVCERRDPVVVDALPKNEVRACLALDYLLKIKKI